MQIKGRRAFVIFTKPIGTFCGASPSQVAISQGDIMDHSAHDQQKTGVPLSRATMVLVAFLAIAGFYLVAEHRAHVFAYLPFVLLLACPLLHVFMHGGHGGHGGTDPKAPAPDGPQIQPPPAP